jgi:hypothetical protein
MIVSSNYSQAALTQAAASIPFESLFGGDCRMSVVEILIAELPIEQDQECFGEDQSTQEQIVIIL